MIKFYKDTYANLASLSGGENNICFATDRHVILMGGAEYGKDQIKKVATSGAIATTPAAAGTLFLVTGEQAIYEKQASGDPIVVLSSVTDAIDALREELSATISTAFAAGKVVLGTTTGITSSNFVPDTTSGDLALAGQDVTAATLSSILVNAATLSANVAAINQNAAHVEGSTSGIAVLTGTPDANGTLYTVGIDLAPATSNTLGFDADGKLTDNVQISAITTTAGYAASYALINTKNNTQLGATINIVKDQFLSGVELVTGTYNSSTGEFTPAANPDDPSANRYIKFVFNVNTDGDSTGEETPKQSTIYLDVNELFDSYTGVSGVAVNAATNQISAVVDPSTETGASTHYNAPFLTVGASGLKVNGIKEEITGFIQDLGSTTATTDKFVTNLGVDATGKLTADVATPHASGVTFTSGGTLTSVTVQAAIEEVVADFDNLLSGLDVAQIGTGTTYIQAIKQEDGKIAASAVELQADKVAYSTTFNGKTITETSGALKEIETVISGMDYAQTAAGTAPSAGTTNALKFVNTVGEVDGKISATTLDLTAANVEASGITAVTTGTSGAVRVAIKSGSQDHVNDQISNILADYLSFHDATGAVI